MSHKRIGSALSPGEGGARPVGRPRSTSAVVQIHIWDNMPYTPGPPHVTLITISSKHGITFAWHESSTCVATNRTSLWLVAQ
jgi:hypothetical protein